MTSVSSQSTLSATNWSVNVDSEAVKSIVGVKIPSQAACASSKCDAGLAVPMYHLILSMIASARKPPPGATELSPMFKLLLVSSSSVAARDTVP